MLTVTGKPPCEGHAVVNGTSQGIEGGATRLGLTIARATWTINSLVAVQRRDVVWLRQFLCVVEATLRDVIPRPHGL